MLTYVLDPDSRITLCEQLQRCIKADVKSGALQPGDRLPSKRSLATNLHISTVTVENAYEQLLSEGYIYSLPRKGYYVAEGISLPTFIMHPNTSAAAGDAADNAADKQAKNADSAWQINLSDNQTAPENFPFSVWSKLVRKVLLDDADALMVNSPCNGVLPLRRAIADHLASFRGMMVDPGQIVVGAGTEYLYGLLIQLLGRDQTYCLENPGYRKIAQVYESNDVAFVYADMDEKGIRSDMLAALDPQVIHISPTHHFPTGITMPAPRRYELLSWAAKGPQRYIIEDDYDSEFRLSGKVMPSLQSMDAREKVIYMNTFSKSLASTIRISYMVLPGHLAERYYRRLSFYSCTVPTFEQYTLARFLSEGYFEKHINRMRLYYARTRKSILRLIEESPLAGACRVIERDSGLHLLLELRTDLPDRLLKERLAQRGVHIRPISDYYISEAPEHIFVLNYSRVSEEDIRKGLEIIATVTRE